MSKPIAGCPSGNGETRPPGPGKEDLQEVGRAATARAAISAPEPVEEFNAGVRDQDHRPEFPALVKIFIIMPFGSRGEYQGGKEESEYVYSEIMCPGIERAFRGSMAQFNIDREVDKAESGSITASIVNGLVKSDIVLVDVTGQNANVFLELGIRYALKSSVTLLLTQEPDKIPFDIQGYRFISYRRFEPERARDAIACAIRRGFTAPRKSDSVVFDVFEKMSVVIPGISESHGVKAAVSRETMSWEDFTNRVRWATHLIERPLKDGRYAPDALVGISNGGLIVAELIGREVLQDKPIVSLWANRRQHDARSQYWFFDNPYNTALCDALKSAKVGHPDEPLRLVLVDDHFGSGTTALQARQFLRDRLGPETKIVYFPIVSRRTKFLITVEDMLPYNYEDPAGRRVFGVTKEEFHRMLSTHASYFPYMGKDIVGE